MKVSRIIFTALETFRETRGPVLPALIAAGGLLLFLVGTRLPGPVDQEGGLGAAFFFGGISLVLYFIATAYGSWMLAQDRQSGFSGFLLSKPLSGAAYYLGRFFGLAVRLTLILLGVTLAGGMLLALVLPDLEFSKVRAPDRVMMEGRDCPMDLPLLLKPEGPKLLWEFAALEGEDDSRAGLRFRFRPRYSKGEDFTDRLPLQCRILQGETPLLEKEMILRNRKSLALSFPLVNQGKVFVELRVVSGGNYLEIEGEGCKLVRGVSGPVPTLLKAAFGLLPVLYLTLALALTFSAFVSVPTALFSTLVLSLVVLLGPSLQAEIHRTVMKGSSPGFEFDHEELSPWKLSALRTLSRGLSCLPDPESGGGLDPLTRTESPETGGLLRPWTEGLPHLLLVMILGCLLAGRRSP